MALDPETDAEDPLTRQLARIRRAETLGDLAVVLDQSGDEAGYFRAKELWAQRSVPPPDVSEGLPGVRVTVDGTEYVVYGITHANTEAEERVVETHASASVEAGTAVYCEQGIRSMYLDGFPEVCAMDDYRWATRRCGALDQDVHLADVPQTEFQSLLARLDGASDDLREATFSLIESGSAIYGEELSAALGDVASDFLTGKEDLATGEDYEAFRRTHRAAKDPDFLGDLQQYYRRVFLPQPLEREWLRRQDRELELLTHARNERMADYVRHDASASAVDVIVGAAHQPGVVYYLQQYRDGNRDLGHFEYVE